MCSGTVKPWAVGSSSRAAAMGDAAFMVGMEIWTGKGVESLQLEAHFDRYLTKISEYLFGVHKSYLFL